MRKRTLFGIVALVFAVPALASDLPRAKPVSPESLVAIADLQAEGAFDDFATPGTRSELIDSARKNYEAALQQEPANKDALRGLARLHARAGNLHKATEANRNYLRFYPNDVQAAAEPAKCDPAVTRAGAEVAASEDGPCVSFELCILKLPAAFYRELNVKLPDDGLLSAEEAKKLLDAAQACRRASVMQCPKITAASGQAVPVSVCDERTFVTGVEAMKVRGATVLVPQNKRASLGMAASVVGRILPDGKSVGVQVMLGRTWLAGEPELVPLATKITPVFEGGSQGVPVPFTQYIQAPDVRTATVSKGANVPAGGTLVVGTWAETQEEKTGRKAKPEAVEYTCVALATVRVLPGEPEANAVPPMQPPEPLPLAQSDAAACPQPKECQKAEVYRLRNVAAADAAKAVAAYLSQRGLKATVTAEAVSNSVLVSAEPQLRRQIGELLAKLDAAREPVIVVATVVRVPRAFVARCGLTAGGPADAKSWTLSAREAQMLAELLRGAKGRGECDVLARPQISMADGQTGFVQVGQRNAAGPAAGAQRVSFEELPVSLALELTPRVLPGGCGVMLATNLRLADKKGTGTREESIRASAQVRPGETLVLASAEAGSFCGALECKGGDSPVTLVILTPAIK
jgi:hypothetical protein